MKEIKELLVSEFIKELLDFDVDFVIMFEVNGELYSFVKDIDAYSDGTLRVVLKEKINKFMK